MRPRNINVDNVAPVSRSHGDGYECQFAAVGAALDSKMIGFNVTFPYHAHRGNEEMFFILEGEGSVRSLPPGRDSAHQINNDSKAPLRYLAVSTMLLPELVEYPDSGKLGVIAGTSGARPPAPDSVRHITRLKDGVDYWDGE